ncbi:MAG: hypothetical protein HUU02_13465 [Bacteroidetes bacterium]|nr:hypothetical protein [Bacteroidota bacterium]
MPRVSLIIVTLLAFLGPEQLFAQEPFKSIHQQEWEYYNAHPEAIPAPVPAPERQERTVTPAKRSALSTMVYGFHPYWMNGTEGNYQYDLLSHLAYFSADVDPVTGNFSSTHNYSSAAVINQAKIAGVKVHLTVVLFSKHDSLWAKQSRQDNLVNNILAKVKERDIAGVNIDFESMKSSDAVPFRKFILQLGDTLRKHNKKLCVELFAVDWSNVMPSSFFTAVDSVVESYFIMLYAYYYSGSSTAGPNAPLMTTSSTSYRHILRSIKYYLDLGVPASKLIAGLPYYGIDWPVSSSARMAATTASGSSRFYNVVKDNYLDTMKAENVFFDATFSTPWYRYQSASGWRQTWHDDSLSLARKYDSVMAKKIGGVGMWALGYDAPHKELWNLLRAKFTGAPNSVGSASTAPVSFGLLRNHPNPFNPSTTITYSVGEEQGGRRERTVLAVYDPLGRLVSRLVDAEQAPGVYSVVFNAAQLSAGPYIARLTSGRSTLSQRLLLIK